MNMKAQWGYSYQNNFTQNYPYNSQSNYVQNNQNVISFPNSTNRINEEKGLSESQKENLIVGAIGTIALGLICRKKIAKGIKSLFGLADDVAKSKVGKESFKKLTNTETAAFQEQANILAKRNLEGLKITKNMSLSQRKALIKELDRNRDINEFALMATGNKPALFTSNSKILKNLNHADYDVVSSTKALPDGVIIEDLVILNKKSVKKVISENMEIYQRRMGLKTDSNVDDIYKILTGKSSPLKSEAKNADIFGLTLGYPPKNTVIFNLRRLCEKTLGDNPTRQEFQATIKKAFNDSNSPYKNFSEEFKKDILKNIDKIDNSKFIDEFIVNGEVKQIYPSVIFTPETKAFERITQSIRNTTSQMQMINKGVSA